jgi:hypothetical protein
VYLERPEREKVIEMTWTPEAVKAEVDYRMENARQHSAVRALREARSGRPSWWKRLKTQHTTQ